MAHFQKALEFELPVVHWDETGHMVNGPGRVSAQNWAYSLVHNQARLNLTMHLQEVFSPAMRCSLLFWHSYRATQSVTSMGISVWKGDLCAPTLLLKPLARCGFAAVDEPECFLVLAVA